MGKVFQENPDLQREVWTSVIAFDNSSLHQQLCFIVFYLWMIGLKLKSRYAKKRVEIRKLKPAD